MLGSVDTHVGEDSSPLPIHFSPPGAYHRARWMAKGIYCLKIYLFREQFKLTSQELQALRRDCLFNLTIYVKAWLSAPRSYDEQLNDLCLLHSLESYAEIDSQVSEVALRKMRGHLWYLSEDLLGLAFSDRVSDSEKQAMVDALKKPKLHKDVRRVDPKSVTVFQTMTLSNIVTENLLHLFMAMRTDPACITGNPSAWCQCAEYASAKQITGLKVINDCAERAVKLTTDLTMPSHMMKCSINLSFKLLNTTRSMWHNLWRTTTKMIRYFLTTYDYMTYTSAISTSLSCWSSMVSGDIRQVFVEVPQCWLLSQKQSEVSMLRIELVSYSRSQLFCGIPHSSSQMNNCITIWSEFLTFCDIVMCFVNSWINLMWLVPETHSAL